MGNWRTVHIDGSIDESQVKAARDACLYDWDFDAQDNDDLPHALSYGKTPSLCGLHEWPASRINVVGNLYERDCGVDSVAEALRHVAKAAPSLRVKVHCGGEYESTNCVATIHRERRGSNGWRARGLRDPWNQPGRNDGSAIRGAAPLSSSGEITMSLTIPDLLECADAEQFVRLCREEIKRYPRSPRRRDEGDGEGDRHERHFQDERR